MKKLLLSLGLLVSVSSFVAQTSIQLASKNDAGTATVTAITNGMDYPVSTSPRNQNVVNVLKMELRNVSVTTNSYSISRFDELLSESTNAYFCIVNCFSPATTITPAGSPIIMAPNTTFNSLLTADLEENKGFAGYNRVRYKFTNLNNPADTLSFRIVYNQEVISVRELANNLESVSEVSPNPVNSAKAFITVNATKASDCQVKCMNALGAVLYTKTYSLNEGKNKFDVINDANLSDGLYFITIQQGNQTLTRRFIVNR